MVSFSPGQEAARRLLEGPQRYTCLAGGTRSGKTFLITRAILARALKAPGSRHAILRFHANAARASIALDTLPNVARHYFPKLKLRHARQDGFFELPNKSRIWIGGLDDKERVEKILGLEYASIFLNEASQIPYASALVAFTRLAQKVEGLKQRAYVDLNPVAKSHWTNRLFGEKRDPVSMQKLKDPKNYARGFLNPVDNTGNLAPEFLESLANLPERQRKRFYEGVYVDEVEAALWTYEIIETARCDPAIIPESGRASVVVALDPSGAAGRDDLGADEIGLIVAARGTDGDCYVLADRSCREAPAVWGRRAVTAFHEFRADCIVAESNFGGEMVRATIQAADPSRSGRHLIRQSGRKRWRARQHDGGGRGAGRDAHDRR
ncbi:MAG: phage terminase large subunit [Methylovirgula sp.]